MESMRNVIFLLILVLYGNSMCEAKCQKPEEIPLHEIYVTNYMNHRAPIRCFRYDVIDNYLGNKLLQHGEETKFTFRNNLTPETMYYCTTTNGSFVAYKESYDCAQNKVNLCEWRIHETYAELYSLNLRRWVPFDYEPVKNPGCYKNVCLRFPRGYPSHKAPCHEESPHPSSLQ
ncbi:putative AP2/ERF domain-containing transcription factor [Hibiscus syriacus]|uniref:AP2/ERF domain-containing transcription factor n=1 Tax=Hibiscus syriacus TaxID=106335 RepID=A0A6A3CYD4_HIBSY|nr:putative AP2/ERF domain-containing transcription factor [Hibiscus syriacus]